MTRCTFHSTKEFRNGDKWYGKFPVGSEIVKSPKREQSWNFREKNQKEPKLPTRNFRKFDFVLLTSRDYFQKLWKMLLHTLPELVIKWSAPLEISNFMIFLFQCWGHYPECDPAREHSINFKIFPGNQIKIMAGQSKDAGNTITKLCFKEKQAGFGYFSNEMKSEARKSHTLICSQ